MVEFAKDLVLSFIPLFVAVDALGTLPFILSLTHEMTPDEQPRVIRHAMITAFGLGLGFVAIGQGVVLVLGIEIADFLVAGGLVLLVLAIRYLVTGKWVEMQAGMGKELLGVVPIGTPLVVGPAVLTTLLLLIQQYSLLVVSLAFMLNLVFAWLLFAQADRVARLLREPGLRISSQVASLLLVAIAVMMIRKGLIQIMAG